MTAFRWHRAPDWTPALHVAADRHERAMQMLADATTHDGLLIARDLLRVAQDVFSETVLALDQLRRPEIYCKTVTPAIRERDPTAKCPTCSNVQLYTDFYDKCFACGRNIGQP